MQFITSGSLPYVIVVFTFLASISPILTLIYDNNLREKLLAPSYADNDYNENLNEFEYQLSPQGQGSHSMEENTWTWARPQAKKPLNFKEAYRLLNHTPLWQPGWPREDSVSLGQVSAVAVDAAGNVLVFHRAAHAWDASTFNMDNTYRHADQPPINTPTVLVLNGTGGELVDAWGENLFYLPHGLTVDRLNNVWVTDVALHQVFKFTPADRKRPALTLGVRFRPGNDDKHFCKPSAVAVLDNGEFFISDGYCNTRVIKYSAQGEIILQWGRSTPYGEYQLLPRPYEFSVPHALALAQDKDLLFVADRENGRVQCFHASNGSFVTQYHSPVMGHRIFSIAYSPAQGGRLYVVNGPSLRHTPHPVRGFVIAVGSAHPDTDGRLLSQFYPGYNFRNPHDVAVSPDGASVYVAELDPHKVYKFVDATLSAPHVDVAPAVPTTTTQDMDHHTAKLPIKPTVITEDVSAVYSTSLGYSSGWAAWAGVAGGLAGGLGAVLMCLAGAAALLARARRRGCLKSSHNRRQRKDYSDAPDFKLRHLLERPRGFQPVNTEESDDEPTPATSMLAHAPQNA